MITRVICIGSGENHVPRCQRAVCHHPAASRRRQPELDHIAAHQLQLLVGDGVLKRGPEACPVGRVPAAEIEAAVVDQLRGIFWQPEIIVGTRRAARAEQDGVTEDEARAALIQLDPLWEELFPAEQARIVQLLVERIDVGIDGVSLRLRAEGLAGLVREAGSSTNRRAA